MREKSRSEPIEVSTLPSGRPCPRCNGDRAGDHVSGGWLPHFRRVGLTWYNLARCCPDCTWGAYRQRCTGRPFYGQFDANNLELGILGAYLRSGRSLREAVELVPFGPLRMRLLGQVDAIEAHESGWRQYNEPEPAADPVGF